MVNTQQWINKNYSNPQAEEIYNNGQELQGELIIENFSKLKKIVLANARQITKLIIRNCPLVERIDAYKNEVNELDISGLENLEYLHVGNNKLTKLDVSQNKKLKTLICFNNPLEDLKGIDKLAELSYFNASNSWKLNNGLSQAINANSSGDYSYWTAEIQQKKRELENLKVTFEESATLLNSEIKDLEKNQIRNLEGKIKDLEAKATDYQNQIKNLETVKEQNLQQINNLSNKKIELEREINSLKNNLSKSKKKVESLENELEKEKNNYCQQIEEKDQEIKELRKNLEQEVKKMEEEKNRIIAELNEVKKEIPNKIEKKLIHFTAWSSWEEDEESLNRLQDFLKELETGEGQNIFINLGEKVDWTQLREGYDELRKVFIDLVKIIKQKSNLAEQSEKLSEDFQKLTDLLGVENSFESLKEKISDNQQEIQKANKKQEMSEEEEEQAQEWFKIEEVEVYPNYIRVELNKSICFQGDNDEDRIYLANRYPFNQYRAGDELEINVEEIERKECSENLDDISLVRRIARGKMPLHDWWQEKRITYDERQKLLAISEIDTSPYFALPELKKLLHFDELVKNNREKIDIKGKIWRIILFSTWFNKDCAIIVNGQPNNEDNYSFSLIIYEFPLKNMPEILEVMRFPETYSEVSDIRDKIYSLEARLNSSTPITYKSPSLELLYENEYRLVSVQESNIYSTSNDLNDNPDKYIKPLDIIKTFDSEGCLHTSIYLGNKKICHVLGDNEIVDWEGFYNYYSQPDRIIRYHPVIPYKKSEEVIKHIARANVGGESYHSARGGFDMKKNNCEHFANLCVYGIDISEHHEIVNVKKKRSNAQEIKKIDTKEEIEKNSKFFAELISDDKQVENKIKEITKWTKKEKIGWNQGERLEAQVLITPKDSYYITR